MFSSIGWLTNGGASISCKQRVQSTGFCRERHHDRVASGSRNCTCQSCAPTRIGGASHLPT
jgi:hypothetical protein